jgi:hypothetical protein
MPKTVKHPSGIWYKKRKRSKKMHLNPSNLRFNTRLRAYFLYLENPSRPAIDNWLQAEREIKTIFPD